MPTTEEARQDKIQYVRRHARDLGHLVHEYQKLAGAAGKVSDAVLEVLYETTVSTNRVHHELAVTLQRILEKKPIPWRVYNHLGAYFGTYDGKNAEEAIANYAAGRDIPRERLSHYTATPDFSQHA